MGHFIWKTASQRTLCLSQKCANNYQLWNFNIWYFNIILWLFLRGWQLLLKPWNYTSFDIPVCISPNYYLDSLLQCLNFILTLHVWAACRCWTGREFCCLGTRSPAAGAPISQKEVECFTVIKMGAGFKYSNCCWNLRGEREERRPALVSL